MGDNGKLLFGRSDTFTVRWKGHEVEFKRFGVIESIRMDELVTRLQDGLDDGKLRTSTAIDDIRIMVGDIVKYMVPQTHEDVVMESLKGSEVVGLWMLLYHGQQLDEIEKNESGRP